MGRILVLRSRLTVLARLKSIRVTMFYRSKKKASLGPAAGSGRRNRTPHHNRGGLAVTEFALLLPVVLVLFGGTIELCTAIFLKESLTIAAFEGARKAVTRKATNGDATARIQTILAERGVCYTDTTGMTGPVVSISPSAETADTLQPMTVIVRAPTKNNVFAPFSFLRFCQYEELTARVVMFKEYKN